MENQEKTTTDEAVVDTGDRRSSRLVQGIPTTEAFAGWGPRMTGSIRDVLRGLN